MTAIPTSTPPGPIEMLTEEAPQPFVDVLYEISNEEHFWFQWRREVTLALLCDHQIPLETPWEVLEVGSGAGVLRRQLQEATSWRIDSTDLDLDALERSRSATGRTLFYDIREKRSEFHEKYDVLILFDVLEHIERTESFLEANLFHLKVGGYFLIDVPALQCFFSAYDRAAGHFRRYNRRSLAEEFKNFTFEVLELRYWGATLLPLLLGRNLASMTGKDTDQVLRRGFEPPGEPWHGWLKTLLKVETSILKRPLCGTSLLLLGRKCQ